MKTKRLDTATRRTQIKSAVLKIIAAEGLGKLSTRNLASKVGVTEGALFRHFASKKDILFAIFQDVRGDLLAELREVAHSNASSDKKLAEFLAVHVNYLIANKGITILLFSEAAHMNDSRLKREFRDIFLSLKGYVSKIIEQGIDENTWDRSLSIDSAATLYLGVPISLNMELVLQTGEFDQERFCERMHSLLVRAFKNK